MKKKYILGFIVSFALVGTNYAQEDEIEEDDENLVENWSFEGVKGKLKKLKQLDKAKDWFSPTKTKADIFSRTSSKTSPIYVPVNKYGKEDASEGDNYAGITAYTYRGKTPRTYASTQLVRKMKKGVRYCVSYKVSLADLSKYAVNNLGAHFSKKAFEVPGKKDIVLGKKDVIVKSDNNKIYQKRYSWQKVCGEYVAKGGEKFITIGNFDETVDTKFMKLKKKKEFRGSQVPVAYYYIDEVIVKVVEDGESCDCDEVDKKEIPRIVYGGKDNSTEGLKIEKAVENSSVYFAYLKSDLSAKSKKNLDVLAQKMIDNPKLKLTVYGHTTRDESKAAKSEEEFLELAGTRISNVLEYLKGHGISEDRFDQEVMNDSDPESEEQTMLGKSKNRRVSFEIQE